MTRTQGGRETFQEPTVQRGGIGSTSAIIRVKGTQSSCCMDFPTTFTSTIGWSHT
jgi:hypothetical protein